MKDTSWKQVGKWYDTLVAKEGHTYHKEVIFPRLKEWYSFGEEDAVLDLGCGQGVFARQLPKGVRYVGVDAAKSLLQKGEKRSNHRFMLGDATKPLKVEGDFSHVFIILALQNMTDGAKAIANGAKHLRKGGTLTLVLNHPCYRIPRQSSWGVDEGRKIQYRRIDRYLSPMEIPIQMHPSKGGKSEKTFSYHVPLSTYVTWMGEAGLAITRMEEWDSPKMSTGKWAKMENRARKEFPLFLAMEGTLS
ncbi:class I SAM-dependent methyltransferase [Candidatus Neptunochlamydia vexilliferae]|uniref:Methyltransferase domain-containing protein n=1 Tax=Candidatus Neptunichlamydia vexilliferae TaxID=1651774 RepID=A0ABS0AYJ6_9BACT|nr:class I SAM-dependent methyltransferase [Candidatus Neptunochlamydia vexilliferae]MBF5059202.1 hypothetical protein [Candidatus Neptunochlamydia vexilliferae]